VSTGAIFVNRCNIKNWKMSKMLKKRKRTVKLWENPKAWGLLHIKAGVIAHHIVSKHVWNPKDSDYTALLNIELSSNMLRSLRLLSSRYRASATQPL
jgi:hypothetical protein